MLFRRGPYSGRLAFDPDSGFHIDPKGRKLVTPDEGKTWRYVKRSDSSHQARHERNVLTIDSTANSTNPEPHHFEVQPFDSHYEGLKADPDVVAEKITSHTEAYS